MPEPRPASSSWHLMVLHLAGEPLPALPAIPGRVGRSAAADERIEALFLALFGLEQPDGSVKKVNRSGLRAVLADGYGGVSKSAADCCLDTTPLSCVG